VSLGSQSGHEFARQVLVEKDFHAGCNSLR
jgi:hypothetical protein